MRGYLSICEVAQMHNIMVTTGGEWKIGIPKIKIRKALGSQVYFPAAGFNLI